MDTYHKIKNIYQRSRDGSKALLPGEYSAHEFLYLENTLWWGTEKVDGTNIRICWDGYRVSILGRKDKSIIPDHLLVILQQKFLSGEVEQLFEQTFGEKETILFGEGYGPKINKGQRYRSSPNFILFDVMVNGVFQPRDKVLLTGMMFDVDVVPVVAMGTLPDLVEFVKGAPQSLLGPTEMEGIVARPTAELRDQRGNRIITKIKVADFKKKGES